MHINRSKCAQSSPEYNTSGIVLLDGVIGEQALVCPFNSSSGVKPLLESTRRTGHRRKHPGVIIDLDVDRFSVAGIRAAAISRRFKPPGLETTAVFEPVRCTHPPVSKRNLASADRAALIIKAGDIGVRVI